MEQLFLMSVMWQYIFQVSCQVWFAPDPEIFSAPVICSNLSFVSPGRAYPTCLRRSAGPGVRGRRRT